MFTKQTNNIKDYEMNKHYDHDNVDFEFNDEEALTVVAKAVVSLAVFIALLGVSVFLLTAS